MSNNDKTTNIGYIAAKNVRDMNSRVKYSAEKDLQQQAGLARAKGAAQGDLAGWGGATNGRNMADDFLNKLLKLEQNPGLSEQGGEALGAEQNENEKIDGTNANFLALKEQEAKKYEMQENEAGESIFHFVHSTAGEVGVKVKKQGDRFLVYVDMQQTISLKECYVLGQMMSKILSADLGKNLEVVIG